jgi:threonine dehydratase
VITYDLPCDECNKRSYRAVTHKPEVPLAVGVDGCKGGWIAALCYRQSTGEYTTSLKLFNNVIQLAAWRDKLAGEPPVTIDVPIGLPEVVRFRLPDKEERTRLGPRRDAVFMPPGRYLLEARNYAEVRRLVDERRSKEGLTRGLSAHAAGILPKIREVHEFVRTRADTQKWLFEVHPEVCFRVWAGRNLHAKRSAAGALDRLALVRRMFPDAELVIRQHPFGSQDADLTDVLDTYAALWTALRMVRQEHKILAQETLHGIIASMIV